MSIPAGHPQGFGSRCPSKPCCHTQLQIGNGFVDIPRASWSRRKSGDGCENPASEHHTCVNGERCLQDLRSPQWKTGWIGVGPPFRWVWAEGFAGFAGFFFGLVTGAWLAPMVTMGTNFAFLLFFRVIVSSLRVGVSVTGPRVFWDVRRGSYEVLGSTARRMAPLGSPSAQQEIWVSPLP